MFGTTIGLGAGFVAANGRQLAGRQPATAVVEAKPKPKTKAGKRRKMHQAMHHFKHGEMHSGSKTGPVVTDPKQAIAIGLSQSGQSRKDKK
jgi:hypothetical protein